jgi:hypothetical protein
LAVLHAVLAELFVQVASAVTINVLNVHQVPILELTVSVIPAHPLVKLVIFSVRIIFAIQNVAPVIVQEMHNATIINV